MQISLKFIFMFPNGDRSLHATETTMAHTVLLESISRDIVILEIRITFIIHGFFLWAEKRLGVQ